jgi:hypothetical protein
MGTRSPFERYSHMAFLPAGETREPKGLILDERQALSRRVIEAARARDARDMVSRFFGLPVGQAPR